MDLPNLEAYFDSTVGVTLNGVNVSGWTDQSPNGHEASQATAANPPFLQREGQGSNQVLEFDGSEFLEIP